MHHGVHQPVERHGGPKRGIAQAVTATLLTAERDQITRRRRGDGAIAVVACDLHAHLTSVVSRQIW